MEPTRELQILSLEMYIRRLRAREQNLRYLAQKTCVENHQDANVELIRVEQQIDAACADLDALK